MLEFIVLGQIPGTNIYMSFWEIAGIVVIGSILSIVAAKVLRTRLRQIKIKQQTI